MTTYGGTPYVRNFLGQRIPVPLEGTTSAAGVDFAVTAITASSVTLKLTKVPTTAISAKIGYRSLAVANCSALTYSTVSAVVNSTVTISGLTADQPYQFFGFGYTTRGVQSEPATVLVAIPTRGRTHAHDICQVVKDLLTGSAIATGLLNTELATINARESLSLAAFVTIEDVEPGNTANWPYCAVIAQEAPGMQKIGNRKIWQYIINIEVGCLSSDGDPRKLQRDIEMYMEAVENAIDQYDTLGGNVWEAEIDGKQFSPLLQTETGILLRKGTLILRVDQTN